MTTICSPVVYSLGKIESVLLAREPSSAIWIYLYLLLAMVSERQMGVMLFVG